MKKNLNLFLSMILFCIIAIFSSCVQGDLYDELYDEYDVSSPRTKKSKSDGNTIGNAYSCGACCAAYIKSGCNRPGTSDYDIAMQRVIEACNAHTPRINYQNSSGATGSELQSFFNAIMSGHWEIQSRDGQDPNTDEVIPNYFGTTIDAIIINGTYPMLVEFKEGGIGHWVVATHFTKEKEKGFFKNKYTEIVNEVDYYDPWAEGGGTKNMEDIKFVIYKQ